MKTIFVYELKKIFSRKIVWAGILFIAVVSIGGFTSITPEMVSAEKEVSSRYKGTLDDELVQRMLQDFMPSQEQRELWHGVNIKYIGMNAMQQAVHRYFAKEDGTWNGKTVRDVFGDEKIQIGYYEGWFQFSQTLVRVMICAAVLVLIITAPVFAGEYQGMDKLLHTCRYGRGRCATAKILAAFCASMGIAAAALAANFAAAFCLIGTEGLDSNTLFCGVFYENYMPFSMSIVKMLLYQAGLALSGIWMLIGAALAISAFSKNQIASLIIGTAAFMGPVVFSVAESSPCFKLVALLPVYQLQFTSLMRIGQAGKTVFYAVWAFPCATLFGALGSALAQRAWAQPFYKSPCTRITRISTGRINRK
ncbi:MAG: hypothetical protein Q4E89_04740 [Eubacteriales bacterium]|nr:hypothetical protein [Eubacteriales bacterium]